MCVAVIAHGAVAVFVDEMIVGVFLTAVDVIKIFLSLVIVRTNCNTCRSICRDVCVVTVVVFPVVKVLDIIIVVGVIVIILCLVIARMCRNKRRRLCNSHKFCYSSRLRYCDNHKCIAVLVYGVVAVFVIATVLIAVGVIKIFVSVVKNRMNCNNHAHY